MPWLAPALLIALLVWALAKGSWPLAALSVVALLVSLYLRRRRTGG